VTAFDSTCYHDGMAKKMLPVRFEEAEIEQIRAQAALEGRSLQDYAHDLLINAVNVRAQRRDEVLDRVLRVSAGLNRRLAR
jgi:hypothetical protein